MTGWNPSCWMGKPALISCVMWNPRWSLWNPLFCYKITWNLRWTRSCHVKSVMICSRHVKSTFTGLKFEPNHVKPDIMWDHVKNLFLLAQKSSDISSDFYINYEIHCITIFERRTWTSYVHCSCTVGLSQPIILIPAYILNILKINICNMVNVVAKRNSRKTISM